MARFGVSIVAYPPNRRRHDLDNLLKALLDSLQVAGVFFDDSQVDDLRIRRDKIVDEGMIDVLIQPI